MASFLTVLPRAIFRTNQKSMVELFCKNSQQLLAAYFSAKKPHHKCYTMLPVKKKRNKSLYYFTYFYIFVFDFVNCPAFVDIN